MKSITTFLTVLILSSLIYGCAMIQPGGGNQSALRAQAEQALGHLLAQNDAAAAVNTQAVAVLVFPSVIKGGFLYGGQTGNGVLFRNGVASGCYNTSAISYGLQAGIQDYGYALFFMNERSLAYLDKSDGFELGVGPSVVVAGDGFAKNYTTTTLTQDVYAFVFNQKGIMAGLGITGSKITRLSP
jgi:lipid-binding SYLF domain-containing protein